MGIGAGRPRDISGDGSRGVTFARKRAFLADGAPWPKEPRPDCIETHASLVFLTRDRAWKLKKPVRLIHVDQRSLPDRERLCREEVRLNREMSGDVYRGVTALVQRTDGSLALGGNGRVVDWLIESARLPAGDMLDRRLCGGRSPGADEIGALGDLLVGFYRKREPPSGAGGIFYRRLRQDSRVAVDHLRQMAGMVSIRLPVPALDIAETSLTGLRGEIVERAGRGAVIEGHGDLRAEHVCLTDPPVVFDRVEIDPTLRIVDPFFEINALGLECGLMGAGWIRTLLVERLSGAFAPPSEALMDTFGVILCLTRARFAVDHFRDPIVARPEKYRSSAQAYLDVAADLIGDRPPSSGCETGMR